MQQPVDVTTELNKLQQKLTQMMKVQQLFNDELQNFHTQFLNLSQQVQKNQQIYSQMQQQGANSLTVAGGLSSLSVSPRVTRPEEEDYSWEIDLDDLKIEEKIGEGTFGVVEKASWRGSKVAVKWMKKLKVKGDDPHSAAISALARREFIKEVTMLSKLRHPNIILLLGACTRTTSLCIITEYLAGGSLFHLLHVEKVALNLSAFLSICRGVCLGMNYLHLEDPPIIHRDLKSMNLLLDSKGTVKVADFGWARLADPSGRMTVRAGTPFYLSPEQLRQEPYSTKVDIFAFSLILWEMLTNKLPFYEYDFHTAQAGVATKGLRPKIPENCPTHLKTLMVKCWDELPDNRPSFDQILQFLSENFPIDSNCNELVD
eukprot:TRINITY_DN4408_c0_g6_i1.p1 TRINITY_DN4408_c0_g6~~TRINITY_DN4408_c0_g6_i1.p1  ORF type:complete len:373 (+),score=99.67 TRINITY_DN4408_c0_g6_i1:1397-2515(+)